jgi:hypothetical protein
VNRRAALLALGGLPGLTLCLYAQSLSAAERLRFQDLYGSFGPLGLQFSEGALRLRGQPILMQGNLLAPLDHVYSLRGGRLARWQHAAVAS